MTREGKTGGGKWCKAEMLGLVSREDPQEKKKKGKALCFSVDHSHR